MLSSITRWVFALHLCIVALPVAGEGALPRHSEQNHEPQPSREAMLSACWWWEEILEHAHSLGAAARSGGRGQNKHRNWQTPRGSSGAKHGLGRAFGSLSEKNLPGSLVPGVQGKWGFTAALGGSCPTSALALTPARHFSSHQPNGKRKEGQKNSAKPWILASWFSQKKKKKRLKASLVTATAAIWTVGEFKPKDGSVGLVVRRFGVGWFTHLIRDQCQGKSCVWLASRQRLVLVTPAGIWAGAGQGSCRWGSISLSNPLGFRSWFPWLREVWVA